MLQANQSINQTDYFVFHMDNILCIILNSDFWNMDIIRISIQLNNQ